MHISPIWGAFILNELLWFTSAQVVSFQFDKSILQEHLPGFTELSFQLHNVKREYDSCSAVFF